MAPFLEKAGMPKNLAWGLSWDPHLHDGRRCGAGLAQSLSARTRHEHSTIRISFYCIWRNNAISSWFSGVLAEGYGPRKTMLIGILIYLIGTIGFVGLDMQSLNFPVMLLTYAIRGFGYPLFAYSFLVWITYRTPQNQLGRAVGWFWFVFTGGLNVLGA